MTDWRDTARELLASGMSVNLVSREIGKSEHAIRFNLNINGAADRYRALKAAAGKRTMKTLRSAPRDEEPETPLLKTITLPTVSISPAPVDEPASVRKLSPRVRVRVEKPGVERYREIHQNMIRAGKITGRDLLSEWRA